MPFVALSLLAEPRYWAAGFTIMAIGEGIRLWAVGHIGRISRTRGEGVGALVDRGPYARLRNPLYVGNILIFAGLGTIQWPWVFLLVPMLMAYYAFIVRWEEANLRAQIGAAYVDYCARVPRWWPSGAPKAGAWSGREALRSERGTFAVLAVVCCALLLRCYGSG